MPLTARKSSRLDCRAVLLEDPEKLELLVGPVVTQPPVDKAHLDSLRVVVLAAADVVEAVSGAVAARIIHHP
jgi:hypothetical protein